jgi:hypothetical protein
VQKAYLARVQLWSDGFYATPGLSWDAKTMNGRPFSYFAYGAAVSEVVVDTLTGEWKLLRADALYDAGNSLNPAIDIGQVEGAFIQGMGWLTTEELWWNPGGKLMTHAPSTYKIPGVSDCPEDFRVRLFENRNVEDSIHRSKAVGEPPLLLPFSVFFAIRDAISSVGGHKVNPPLNAPATSEEILDAIAAVEAAADDGVMDDWLTAAAARRPCWSRSPRRRLGAARARREDAGHGATVPARSAAATWSCGRSRSRARCWRIGRSAAPGTLALGPSLGQCCGGLRIWRSSCSTATRWLAGCKRRDQDSWRGVWRCDGAPHGGAVRCRWRV